jgi:hypothetical protein
MALPSRSILGVLVLLLASSGCGISDHSQATGHHHAQPTSGVRLIDPVGDVFLADSPDVTDAVAKTVRNVDVTAAAIRRTARYLQVQLTYKDLAPRASKDWIVTFSVTTSSEGDHTNDVVWERGQYGDSGRVDGRLVHAGDWYQGIDVVTSNSEDAAQNRCPHAATARVDYKKNTVTVRVLSRCLQGDPSWMRVHGLVSRSKPPHPTAKQWEYTDNPFNATASSGSSPRLTTPHP